MRLLMWVLIAAAAVPACAQGQGKDAFNSARVSAGRTDKDAFNRNRAGNFNDYRTSLNKEYARMLREEWGDFNSHRGNDLPRETPVPPTPWQGEDGRQDRAIEIEDVVTPIKDKGKAAPIAPVREDPAVETDEFRFTFMGTPMSVRVPRGGRFALNGSGGNALGDAWDALSGPEYAPLLADCLKLRQKHRLCDWGYLKMLEQLSNDYASGKNAATLLMSYLYSQSGYRIRLGEVNGRLVMLFATQHKLYDRPYYTLDGEMFYPFEDLTGHMSISGAKFAKEQSLSLWIPGEQCLSVIPGTERRLRSKRYPEMDVTVSVNKNLIDFFDTYPTSEVGGNFLTRWAMYANTPMSEHVRGQLYPQLQRLINGLDELAAVERLLNWVQTAFVYEYDSKVWGRDRAFFAEESLYYPYCDCEDRSILFTRLVRDLLGLKCLLIYYPNHLAAAVAFNGNVGGDYIVQNGRRFVVTDPTYIGAAVGRTMPQMDNASAKVIVLD